MLPKRRTFVHPNVGTNLKYKRYSRRKVIMHKRFGFSGLPKTVENLVPLGSVVHFYAV